MVSNIAYNSTDPGVGLEMSLESSLFKCYSADTGLLVSQSMTGEKEIDGRVLRGILYDKLGVNDGMFFENYVAQALAFIRENVSNGISASDVFRHVGFSRTLIERAFRECLSSSVQKQIAEARITEAKRLLETTSRPIKEIAALSGFSTLEYLSRAFAAATGVSPTTWRERSVKNA